LGRSAEPRRTGLNSAATLDEGLEARAFVAAPPFNIVAADASGAIECVTLGVLHNLPRRPGFLDPTLFPPPTLPHDAAPRERDPEAGFVANSNNYVASPTAGDAEMRAKWEPRFRVDRVRERLGERETHSPAEMQVLQTDCLSMHARSIVPLIIEMIDGYGPEWAVGELAAWDYVTAADSRATLLFESFYNRWAQTLLGERLPADLVRGVVWTVSGEAQFEFFDRILRGELSEWLPSQTVAEMARGVFNDTLAWLEERLGSDRESWTWGGLHQLSFRHPFAERGGRIERLTTVGPLPTPGDRSTIWMSWWDPETPFSVLVGPPMRMVADLSQPDR
jgi:penicillin amidase